jgi:MGT family glycosyltransferase
LSHIAFLNIPGHGHVNPTLPVVTELVARGHRVTYAVNDEFVTQVEHAGATPVVYRTTLPTGDQEWPNELASALRLFLADAVNVLPQLEAAYADDRPDLIVFDIGAWTARLLGERWDVPVVQFSPTFVTWEGAEVDWAPIYEAPDVVAAYAEIDQWLGSQGVQIRAQEYVGHPERAIVGIPRSFQPGEKVRDTYTFVGPCLGDRSYQGEWQPPNGKPVLLISLGSAYTNEPEFYRTCLEAFGDSSWHVVLNVGKYLDPEVLGPIPANVEVHRWIPQLEMLKHAKAFITHCGMGGTLEGLYHAVPMVGVPNLGEQAMNAARLEELGVGRHIPRDQVTAEGLRDAVAVLTTDAQVARRVTDIRTEILAAGGTKKAADLVEQQLRD